LPPARLERLADDHPHEGHVPYQRLVLADQSLESLDVKSDGALIIAGSIHAEQSFHANASSIDVTGSIVASGGSVRLLSTTTTIVEGLIDVSAPLGGVGGRAEILGPVVALLDAAVIDARGYAGGGVVLIGGDFQGHNPDIPNSRYALVTAESEIRANALASGPGGTVIVWADSATRFYGLATARGGIEAGDGGLVEVSGKEYLEFHGRADLSAPSGAIGTLLLDPTDIVIANGSADSGGALRSVARTW
jgi:adhesin HecA-like repeat protein